MTGSTFPLSRFRTAELLGFEKVAHNTRDAVLNLDILLQSCAAAVICIINLMRSPGFVSLGKFGVWIH